MHTPGLQHSHLLGRVTRRSRGWWRAAGQPSLQLHWGCTRSPGSPDSCRLSRVSGGNGADGRGRPGTTGLGSARTTPASSHLPRTRGAGGRPYHRLPHWIAKTLAGKAGAPSGARQSQEPNLPYQFCEPSKIWLDPLASYGPTV